jgi:DNA-binding winged helix-turn-helix (wHTH) protein
MDGERDGAPVALSSRYLDALLLMVRDAGRLVPKDRFLDEVWRGVPVTDEALTQCIRTLRRQLGDDVARPQFIETVPKHGYRFIAAVADARPSAAPGTGDSRQGLTGDAAAGTIGAALAGLLGGLFYGFAASQPADAGTGAASALVVILCLCVAVATIGGAGVSFGIAGARQRWGRSLIASAGGGAVGGLAVGAIVRMIASDTLNLLFGHAPRGLTGATEGAALGLASGLAVWLAGRAPVSRRRSALLGAALGGIGGLLLALGGARLMAGSLDLFAQTYPDSRLRLDQLAAIFGDRGFGRTSLIFANMLEGALFAACVAAAMALARRRRG